MYKMAESIDGMITKEAKFGFGFHKQSWKPLDEPQICCRAETVDESMEKEAAMDVSKIKNGLNAIKGSIGNVAQKARIEAVPTIKAFAKNYPFTTAGLAAGAASGAMNGIRRGVDSVGSEDVYDDAGYYKGKKSHPVQKTLSGAAHGTVGALTGGVSGAMPGILVDNMISQVRGKTASETIADLLEKEAGFSGLKAGIKNGIRQISYDAPAVAEKIKHGVGSAVSNNLDAIAVGGLGAAAGAAAQYKYKKNEKTGRKYLSKQVTPKDRLINGARVGLAAGGAVALSNLAARHSEISPEEIARKAYGVSRKTVKETAKKAMGEAARKAKWEAARRTAWETKDSFPKLLKSASEEIANLIEKEAGIGLGTLSFGAGVATGAKLGNDVGKGLARLTTRMSPETKLKAKEYNDLTEKVKDYKNRSFNFNGRDIAAEIPNADELTVGEVEDVVASKYKDLFKTASVKSYLIAAGAGFAPTFAISAKQLYDSEKNFRSGKTIDSKISDAKKSISNLQNFKKSVTDHQDVYTPASFSNNVHTVACEGQSAYSSGLENEIAARGGDIRKVKWKDYKDAVKSINDHLLDRTDDDWLDGPKDKHPGMKYVRSLIDKNPKKFIIK